MSSGRNVNGANVHKNGSSLRSLSTTTSSRTATATHTSAHGKGSSGTSSGISRLRGFLDAKKREMQRGPPPTATETMLNSHLDKSRNRKKRAIRRETMGGSSERVVGISSGSGNENSKGRSTNGRSTSNAVMESAWAKVDRKNMNMNMSIAASRTKHETSCVVSSSSSAKTIDDLLGVPSRMRNRNNNGNGSKKLKSRQTFKSGSKSTSTLESAPKEKIKTTVRISALTNDPIICTNQNDLSAKNQVVKDDANANNQADLSQSKSQTQPQSKSSLVLLPLSRSQTNKVQSMKRKRFAYSTFTNSVSSSSLPTRSRTQITQSSLTTPTTANDSTIVLPTLPVSIPITSQCKTNSHSVNNNLRNPNKIMRGTNDDMTTSDMPMHEQTKSSSIPMALPLELPPKQQKAAMMKITTTATKTATTAMMKKRKAVNNDNFVRLNLKNSAGACRGARKSFRKHNRMKRRRAEFRQRHGLLGVMGKDEERDDGGEGSIKISGSGGGGSGNFRGTYKAERKKIISIHAAIDPLDDFLDGAFHASNSIASTRTATKKNMKNKAASSSTSNEDGQSQLQSRPRHPICPRHQRPCKLLIVKKNTSGNKGRKFYACSMPQGEQCNFFQWEDDTVEAATAALLHSSSKSGFIARQVASHVDRLKVLTVPELRVEAKRRGLNATGKKKSILARLSVWTRDEISNSVFGKNEGEGEGDIDDSGVANTKGDGDEDTFLNEVDKPSKLSKSKIDLSRDDEEENLESTRSDDDEVSFRSSSHSEGESDSSDDELEICGLASFPSDDKNSPMDEVSDSDKIPTSPLHSSLRSVFGYEDFREGQEWAIKRCLSKKRSLLVAPTGLGKSLCYSLPSVLMDGVCIVVSPLVSLMEDQLRHLPPAIPAATLSGNMTAKKMAMIIDDLLRNRLKILFMSPERLASAAFRRLLRPKYNLEKRMYERQLPKVSLLCVDEAHCLSQWGHNFRSAYLRLRTLLSKLEPESVLALTATAGPPVVRDICYTLQIPLGNDKAHGEEMNVDHESPYKYGEANGVKLLSCNRDNIDIAVSFLNDADERLQMLLKILRPSTEGTQEITSDGKKQSDDPNKQVLREGILSRGSIIIYVWRKRDAEVIAEQLKGFDLLGGVVCYHGGMDSTARSKSQSQFMRGKVRICVATVAFGLGINKSDVRGIVHLCLPPSPEHHLQEIGRAGRDGKSATAIALVLESEASHKLSLSYSDRVSKSQIQTLLLNMKELINEYLKLGEGSEGIDTSSRSHMELALPITPLVQTIDCKQETIETALSILEDTSSHCKKLLDIEGIIPDIAIVTLKRQAIEKLALKEDVARCIQTCGETLDSRNADGSASTGYDRFAETGGTATEKGFLAYSFGVIKFSVSKCAYLLGPTAEPRHVYAALRRLEDCGELELSFNNEGQSIHVRLNVDGLSFFRDENENCFEELSNAMHHHFSAQDDRRAMKVMNMHGIMQAVSAADDEDVKTKKTKKSKRLETFQEKIQYYFDHSKEEMPSATVLSKKNLMELGVQAVDNNNPMVRNSIVADVTMLLQHPSLTKSYTYFSKSVQFGKEGDYDDYTSLSIAKILHGIDSPRAPVLGWYNHPLWGRWRTHHFPSLREFVEMSLEESRSR